MNKKYILTNGQHINYLTMLSDVYYKKIGASNIRFAVFKCDLCGGVAEQRYYEVASSRTKSCGCLKRVTSDKVHRKGTLIDSEGYKICSKCQQRKHHTEFRKANDTKDKYYSACNNCATASQNLCKYGITTKEYQEILDKQNNQCKICGHSLYKNNKKPNIDHNHDNNIIRGILCHHCNLMLGHFKEQPHILHRAIQYLKNDSIVYDYQI